MEEKKINDREKEQEDVKEVNLEQDETIEEKANSEEKPEDKSTKKSAKKSVFKSKEKRLQEEIEELNEKNAELKDKYLRLVAEYENFRKRTAKEKIELRDNVKSGVILDFITVVDDVDRAMLHIQSVKDVESTVEGIKLIYHKFYDFLKSHGLEEIEAKNQEFNTDFHEAVTKFPVEDEDKKGKVIDVVQKGYKINEKVIRFSKVVIGE